MWVRSLGREDPLEKEMATHFSALAWKIPWTEKPGGLESKESQRITTEHSTKPLHCTVLQCLLLGVQQAL